MTKKKIFLLFIAILITASFFRLFSIKTLPPGLYPDEAMNGNNALEAIKTDDYKIFYPENNGREGLFINIQAFFLKIFMNGSDYPEPWMLRITSAFFGILTVAGIFLLTKELIGLTSFKAKKTTYALLASFLLATSFWHINFSRIGFRAIMAPFFLTWSIYFLLKSFKTNSKIYILNSLLAGLFFSLGFYSYIAYRVMPILILIILIVFIFKSGWKKVLKITAIFSITAIIVALPLLNYFMKNPSDFFGRTSQISVFNSETPIKDLALNILKVLGMFNFYGDNNWRHNIAGKPLLFLPIGIFFLVGIFMGIKKISSVSLISFAWLITAAMPVVISNEGLPHTLRAIIMIPPIFILASLGGIEIHSWLSKFFTKKILFAVCSLLFIVLIYEAYWNYFISWGKNQNTIGSFNQNYVEIGKEINRIPKEKRKYVIIEAGGTDVRGKPMSAQTVMFITDSFLLEKQKEKNIFYILPSEKNTIPENSFAITIN